MNHDAGIGAADLYGTDDKTVLCFGDSNTYGYIPGGFGRYRFHERWPGRLQDLLGSGWHVVEEGLCGRTCAFDEPGRPGRAGTSYFGPCIASHRPLCFAVIMLGTNDCKTMFRASAQTIAVGLEALIDIARAETHEDTRILIISPPHIEAKAGFRQDFPEFDERSTAVSAELADFFKKSAESRGCLFLDAAELAAPSPADGIHIDLAGHTAIAEAAARIILKEAG